MTRGHPALFESVHDRRTVAETAARRTSLKDDTEETVRHRLSVYHSQTKPLVDFYQKLSAAQGKPKYSHIAGVGSVEAITGKLLEALS